MTRSSPRRPPLPPDTPPPRLGPLAWIRLIYRSQRASVRLVAYVLVPLVLVALIGGTFSIQAAGWAATFDVLIGAGSAFEHHAGPGGVIVALAGYLIVPAISSALIAEAWQRIAPAPPPSGGGPR
jgi:hypothetical protein